MEEHNMYECSENKYEGGVLIFDGCNSFSLLHCAVQWFPNDLVHNPEFEITFSLLSTSYQYMPRSRKLL
jgi:hypothetical protein